MSDDPRFTLTLTLRDANGFQQPISWAIGVDEACRISSRAVDELKMGAELGISTMSMDSAIEMMRVREIRRKRFKELAVQLAGQMVDRMEDAEGWHDPDRIEPARQSLGGDW